MADFNEPVDNPWARPAPAPPAVDDDDGDHEHASHGARDGGHHEAARPSGSAPSSAIGGTAPTRMESQRRLAADPVAAVPKSDAPRKAGRGRCLQRCCRGFHRVLVESSTGGVSLLLILALASLGLFSYSAWLLDGRATVGSGCDDQTCVRGYSAGDTCAGFATLKAGMKCENVCTSRELAGVVPFRFTMYPPPTGVSNADRWLSCPFPRTNSNWRIPVTFFTGLLNLGGVIGYCLRWRRAMGLMAFLTLASAGFHFYLMIIDSDAVNKAALACASNFAGVTTAYGPASPTGIYGGGVTCDMVPYQAVAAIDGLLVLVLIYAAFVQYGRYGLMQGLFREGGKTAVASWGRLGKDVVRGQAAADGVDFGPQQLDPEEMEARREEEARARQRFAASGQADN